MRIFRKRQECQTPRIPWEVHGTFRVRIKSLDAFDQTHYKFRHNGLVRLALGNEAAGFFIKRANLQSVRRLPPGGRLNAVQSEAGKSSDKSGGTRTCYSLIISFPVKFPDSREFVALKYRWKFTLLQRLQPAFAVVRE